MENFFDYSATAENDIETLYGSIIYHLFDKDIKEASQTQLINDFLAEYSKQESLEHSTDNERGILDIEEDIKQHQKVRPTKLEYFKKTKIDSKAVPYYYDNIIDTLPVILPENIVRIIKRKNESDSKLIQRKLHLRRIKRKYYQSALKRLHEFSEVHRAIIIKSLQADIAKQEIIAKLRKKLNNKNISEKAIVIWFVDELTEVVQKKKIAKIKNIFTDRKNILGLCIISFIALLFFFYTWFNYSKAMYFYNKGIVNLKKDNLQQGESNFVKGFKIYPSIKQCNRYAEWHIKQKNYQRAEKKYQKSLSIKPNHYKTLTNYVTLFVRQRKFLTAEKIYSNYLHPHYPVDNKILSWWGEIYIEWGKQDASKLLIAKKNYQKIPLTKKYMPLRIAKNMNIDLLQSNYLSAKEKYLFLENNYPKYLDMLSYLHWLNYLIDSYEMIIVERQDYFKGISLARFNADQAKINDIIIKILNQFSNSKFKQNPYYAYLQSKWSLLNQKYLLAEKQSEKGLTYFKENENPYYFNQSDLFLINGISQYWQKKYLTAVDNFKLALINNHQNFLAHYYLGNVYSLHADDLDEGMMHYENAFQYWQNKEQQKYYQLLYRLGYFNYKLGLTDGNKSGERGEAEIFFQKSLKYWNHPQFIEKQDQIIEYCLGLIYLRLEQYDFAYAIYSQQLEKFLPLYRKYEKLQVIEDAAESKNLHLLTEIYNNLAIALVGKEYIAKHRLEKLENRPLALNYFHLSTKLRKKLKINESDSLINFHLLLKYENTETPIFKISDSLLKKDLI